MENSNTVKFSVKNVTVPACGINIESVSIETEMTDAVIKSGHVTFLELGKILVAEAIDKISKANMTERELRSKLDATERADKARIAVIKQKWESALAKWEKGEGPMPNDPIF